MRAKFYLFLALLLSTSVSLSAQNSRQYIKERIGEWGSCRSVAITMNGGDLALTGRNTCAARDIPRDLQQTLDELIEQGEYIEDVQLTEKGSWLVHYGINCFRWSNIPSLLEKVLNEYEMDLDGLEALFVSEFVSSVSFNDDGNWILISNERILSSPDLGDDIEEGTRQNGEVLSAHMTNDGLVVCYENGFMLYGDVPEKVREKLGSLKFKVYRLKFLPDGTCFMADKDGTNYDYYM